MKPERLDAALGYANRGWPVLALTPGGKVPISDKELQPHGSKSASTNVEHICKLWELYPLANVGIATGEASGITVIDLDDERADAALKEAGLKRPRTYTVKTPRGFHLYLEYDKRIGQTAGLLDHVDVRSTGGYVVAPPSSVNGTEYTVQSNVPIVGWLTLAEYAEKPRATLEKTEEWETWVSDFLTNGAPEGQRNNAATRLAGYFRSLGTPRDVAYASLLQFAERCDPPLHRRELQTIVGSVWQYQPTKPHTYQGNTLEAPLMDASSETIRVFQWPSQGITVRIERLRDTGRRLECWITISTDALGKIYGPIALDLLSTNQRDLLRRALREREEQDWMAIIQHVADLVIQSLDPASDLIDLTSHIRTAETPWLLEPFIRALQPFLLYSDGGEGKSTLALALAIQLATGDAVLPRLRAAEPMSTLYLDWESDPDDMQLLMEQICAGANTVVPAGRLIYRRLSGALTDHLEAIQRDVIQNEVQFVVTDSIIAATGGDTNEAATARAYFDAMRLLKVASLGVTHLTKEGRTKPFGSVYYWNLARAVWRLRQDQEEGESWADIGLFHEKFNRGQRRKPLGFRIAYADDAIQFTSTDVAAMHEVSKSASVADQITEVLKGGNLLVQGIYDELPHLKQDTIRQVLNRKTRVPRFTNLGERGWGLAVRDASQLSRDASQDRNVTLGGGLRPPTPRRPRRVTTTEEESLGDASSLDGESSHAPPKKKTGKPFFDGVN